MGQQQIPEFFRIDCSIEPFEPRIVNGLDFHPVYENPYRPRKATGLAHMGQLEDTDLHLYAGLDEHWKITRMGTNERDAYEANIRLTDERKAAWAGSTATADAPTIRNMAPPVIIHEAAPDPAIAIAAEKAAAEAKLLADNGFASVADMLAALNAAKQPAAPAPEDAAADARAAAAAAVRAKAAEKK